MTNHAIVQIDIPASKQIDGMLSYRPDLVHSSRACAARAAARWGADHIVIEEQIFDLHPAYEKLRFFGEEFDKYSHILYLDVDAIIKADCANPFARTPAGFWGLHEPGWYRDGGRIASQTFDGPLPFQEIWQENLEEEAIQLTSRFWVENHYFNSGVMLIDRDTRALLKDEINKFATDHVMYDQTALNRMLLLNSIAVNKLSPYFNVMVTSFFDVERIALALFHGGIIHFAGDTKSLSDFVSVDDGLEEITRGIDRWMNSKSCTPRLRHSALRRLMNLYQQ